MTHHPNRAVGFLPIQRGPQSRTGTRSVSPDLSLSAKEILSQIPARRNRFLPLLPAGQGRPEGLSARTTVGSLTPCLSSSQSGCRDARELIPCTAEFSGLWPEELNKPFGRDLRRCDVQNVLKATRCGSGLHIFIPENQKMLDEIKDTSDFAAFRIDNASFDEVRKSTHLRANARRAFIRPSVLIPLPER